MAKNKGSRNIIILECSCKNSNNAAKRSKGVFRYATTKNKRNTPNRIELRKFCPRCNKHQVFKEIK